MKKTAKKLFSLLSALLILGFFCKNVMAKSIPVHQAKKRLHSFIRTYVKRNNIQLPAGKLFDYINQGSQLINEETNNGMVDSQRISFIENNFRDFIKAEYPAAPPKKIQQPRRYQTTTYKKKTAKPYKAKKHVRYNYKKKQLTPKKRYVPKQRKLKKKYYKAKQYKHNIKKQYKPNKPKQRKTKAKKKPYLPKKTYKKTAKKRLNKKKAYRPKKGKTKRTGRKPYRKQYVPKKRNPKNYRKPQRHAPNETTISYAEIKVRRNISKARVPRKERLRVFNSIMQKIRAQSQAGKINRDTLKTIIERELSTYRTQKRTTPIRPKRKKVKRRFQPRKKTKPRKVTPTTQILNRYQA